MNAERLLKHYEKIADAPDAIARLRRFILDLAVRGKLVSQDAKDEPASELLTRIAKEKVRLVKAGEIRKLAGHEVVAFDERPFDIPQTWKWVRLGAILTKLTDGTHHSPPNEPTGDFKYITAKNIKNEGVLLDDVTYVTRKVHNEIFARCNPAKGDLLYIKDGATTGIVTVNDLEEPFSMLSSVALLKLPKCIFNRLVVEFLRSPFFYDQMRGFMKGAAITRVTLKRMGPALIPLPPLAEQHRIVAKVDELMDLCDRLEAARADREARRDRLTAASLARLDAADPETRQADARFAINALPALSTRPDQINVLRQTILNLAVRGKLVPQDPNDEPATELLKRIVKEKARLVKAGKIRKGHPLRAITSDDWPFDLPRGWVWTRLGDLIHLVSGQHLQPSEYSEDPRVGLPYITGPSDFATVGLQISRFALVRKAVAKKGQLLLTVKGSGVGKTAICDVPEVAISRQLMALTAIGWEDRFLLLATHRLAEKLQTEARSLIPGISREDVDEFVFPLPSLAEQNRIVAKADALMALCDRLEASLTAAASTRRSLLDALLAEALAPADNRALEAAE